jgi:hypothetical protein
VGIDYPFVALGPRKMRGQRRSAGSRKHGKHVPARQTLMWTRTAFVHGVAPYTFVLSFARSLGTKLKPVNAFGLGASQGNLF